jgi:hypothetical protein
LELSIGHQPWNIPRATKLGIFNWPPNMEHSKGHQAWNFPLVTKLGSSIASFLPFLIKGANSDHLSLYFQTWFPIWIFENLFL